MTGTSLDGLDAVLTRITGRGLSMSASYINAVSESFKPALRDALMQLTSGKPVEPVKFLETARLLGQFHAETIQMLSDISPEMIDFVVAHGQTIWHAPNHPQPIGPLSWQLMDPWPIVSRLQIPVCYDLRQADLIAGGQGAPITPIADRIMYPDADLILNLGGICNYTRLPHENQADPGRISGCDITVCNLLLDGLIQQLMPDHRYDEDGRIAASGWVAPALVESIDRAIETVTASSATLGREQFGSEFLKSILQSAVDFDPPDILASAVAVIATRIQSAVETNCPSSVVLAGGGARNHALVAALIDADQHAESDRNWRLSDEVGIPCQAREAMGFAVLGAMSQDGIPITLPQVTGSERPGVAGTWVFPGAISDWFDKTI